MKKAVKKKVQKTRKKRKGVNLGLYAISVLLVIVGLAGWLYMLGFSTTDLLDLSLYQNLANPSVRVVRVYAGLRKEEIAEVFYKNLDWTKTEAEEFASPSSANSSADSAPIEGHLLPKTYLINKDATPDEVRNIMLTEFDKAFAKIQAKSSKKIINEEIIIKIASIIQREASGKKDMPLISGIIWNRFWKDMKLEMDSTIQYAKGSEEKGWWTQISNKDKKIDSPYNTYLYEGFPPGAISNPSLDAINAAFNPAKTDCIFYIHDKNHITHCAKTYEEHKQNVEKYL